MHIILNNGKRIYGESYGEVLRGLKNSTYFKQTMDEYMSGVAKRAQIFDGSEIEYTNAESFLKELERIQIISIRKVELRRTK